MKYLVNFTQLMLENSWVIFSTFMPQESLQASLYPLVVPMILQIEFENCNCKLHIHSPLYTLIFLLQMGPADF